MYRKIRKPFQTISLNKVDQGIDLLSRHSCLALHVNAPDTSASADCVRKYAKAAAVDPSCANDANNHRAKLRYPSKDELFKRGLKSGDSVHVGCWIQENTTVR